MSDKNKLISDIGEVSAVGVIGGIGAAIPAIVAAAPSTIVLFAIGGVTAGLIQTIPKIKDHFMSKSGVSNNCLSGEEISELLDECIKNYDPEHFNENKNIYKNALLNSLKEYAISASQLVEEKFSFEHEVNTVFDAWYSNADIFLPYNDENVDISKKIIRSYIASLILLECKKPETQLLQILKMGELSSEYKQMSLDIQKMKDDAIAGLSPAEKERIDKIRIYYQEQKDVFEKADNTFISNESLKDSYIMPRTPQNESMLDFIMNWYQKNDHGVFLLYGKPGDGKTSFCRKLVYDYLIHDPNYEVNASVMQFPLNQAKSHLIDIPNGSVDIQRVFHLDNETEPLIKLEDCAGKLIILDGFDEILYLLKECTNIQSYLDFHDNVLFSLAKRYKIHFVVTSRGNALKGSDKYEAAYYFAPLNYTEQFEWCKKRNPDLWDKYLKKVCEGSGLNKVEESIYELIKIPFIFRLVVHNNYVAPKDVCNRASLFADLFNKTMKRTTHHKKEEEVFSIEKLSKDYQKLAFDIWCFDENSAYGNDKEKDILLLAYYIKESEDTGRLSFMHKSFYDYYSALYFYNELLKCEDYDKAKYFVSILAERIIDFDILDFFEEIVTNDHRDVEELIKNIINVIDKTDAIGIDTKKFYQNKGTGTIENLRRCNNIFTNVVSISSCLGSYFMLPNNFYRLSKIYSLERAYLGNRNSVTKLFDSAKVIDGVNLTEAKMLNHYLLGCCFRRCDFSGTTMNKCYMRDITWENCSFWKTDFYDSDLESVVFSEEIFNSCIFVLSQLKNAKFIHGSYTDCKYDNARMCYAKMIDSDFRNSFFIGADLGNADLTNSSFFYCHFNIANLENANLQNAKLTGSDISNANIYNANLDGVCIKKVKMDDEQKRYIDIHYNISKDFLLSKKIEQHG